MARLVNRGLLVTIALVVAAPQDGNCFQRMALTNYGKYTFQNVMDFGFLSSIGGREHIVTDGWKDFPTQKWEVQKGYLYTSYLFKPTSEGYQSKVAMSIDTDSPIPIVKKQEYTFGMASVLYWSIIPGEQDFYMIQNLQNDLCLESRGLGQPVGVSPCRGLKSQLWAVHIR